MTGVAELAAGLAEYYVAVVVDEQASRPVEQGSQGRRQLDSSVDLDYLASSGHSAAFEAVAVGLVQPAGVRVLVLRLLVAAAVVVVVVVVVVVAVRQTVDLHLSKAFISKSSSHRIKEL